MAFQELAARAAPSSADERQRLVMSTASTTLDRELADAHDRGRRLQGRAPPAGDGRARSGHGTGSTARWWASCSAFPASGSSRWHDVATVRPPTWPPSCPCPPSAARRRSRDLLRRRRPRRGRPHHGARRRAAGRRPTSWCGRRRWCPRRAARALPGRRRAPRLQGDDARRRRRRLRAHPEAAIVRLHSGDPTSTRPSASRSTGAASHGARLRDRARRQLGRRGRGRSPVAS